MYLLNNLKFDIAAQHNLGDTQYPRGWFLNAENRAAVGVTEAPDPVWPDPELFSASENPDGTLTVTPLSAEAIAARQAAALEQARLVALNEVIAADTVVNQLKGMTTAEFDAWWAANVTTSAQAIGVLKRVTRIALRRMF